MEKALLIVGHGSRAKEAKEIFNQVVQFVSSGVKDIMVEGAHMELCHPSIPEVVEKLVAKGATEITFVPYFLYKGIHLQEDIPGIIEEISEKYHSIQFKMAEPIGAEPVLAQILLNRAEEATFVQKIS